MTFYEDMQGVATELLTEFNQGALRLKRHTPGGGPPHNPGAPTYVPYPVSGVVSGVSEEHLKDTLIKSTDLVAKIAVPDYEPRLQDRFEIDGSEINIVKVRRIPEAGTAVAFEVFLRR